MRTSGLFSVLVLLLFCPTLRAESPDGLAERSVSGANATPKGATAVAKVSVAGGCLLSGTATPAVDLQIVDAENRPLARFGGVPLPLTLSDLPERADGGTRIATVGEGRLHVAGFVPVRGIPLYLKRDLTMFEGHVTIPRGTAVEYAGSTGDQLRIRMKTVNVFAETYEVLVGCDHLALEAQKPSAWSPPGHARGYLMKQPSAPLFDKPGADAKPVTTLHLATNARGALFFGDRREGDYVHVLYRRDVAIDGWMSAVDLEILPRGEVVEEAASKYSPPVDKKLQMKAEGQLYRANGDIPLYGKADAKLPPIGTVSKDTELYVLDVMVGWANVLPKRLDVVPVGEKHFWVKASELGM